MADRWVVTKVTEDKSVGTIVNNVFASTRAFHTYEDLKRIVVKIKSGERVAGNQTVEYQIWLCRENGEREMIQVL